MNPILNFTDVLVLIAILLIIGISIFILSTTINVTPILPLLIAGIIIGKINSMMGIISVPEGLVVTTAVLSLIMIVFSGASNIKMKEIDKVSGKAFQLAFLFILFNIIILLPIGYYMYHNYLKAILLSTALAGTDAGAVFTLLKEPKNELENLLRLESVINTPLIIVIPLLILRSVEKGIVNSFSTVLPSFLNLFIIGIGTGVVIGVITMKILRHMNELNSQQIFVFSSAFLTYILSEILGGDGIIAVLTLGIMMGTYYKKTNINIFSENLATVLSILIFLLLGMVIEVNFNLKFFLHTILIFIALIISRSITIKVGMSRKDYTFKEELFAILLPPKGIATLIVALSFMVMDKSLKDVTTMILWVVVYSLIISSLAKRWYTQNDTARPSRK